MEEAENLSINDSILFYWLGLWRIWYWRGLTAWAVAGDQEKQQRDPYQRQHPPTRTHPGCIT